MLVRIGALWCAIFRKPASLETPEHRGRERIRRATLAGLASLCSTVVAVAVSLITIPLTIGYLGAVRYGVWLTISSLLSWLTITDLGIGGVALVNALSEARGRDDRAYARSLVSTAFFALCGAALLMVVVFCILYSLLPWARLFNAEGAVSNDELRMAVACAFFCFVLSFPLGMGAGIYAGYQEGYVGSIWNTAANLVSLVALLVVCQKQGGLPSLVLALSGSRLVVVAANMIYLFYFRHAEVRPNIRWVSRASFRRLFGLGWRYVAQQMGSMGMFQTQPLLITQILGPHSVGVFNVTNRILSLPWMFVQWFTAPLLPAYSEARARNDWPWIWKTLKHSVTGAVLAVGFLMILLVMAAKPIIRCWAGAEMIPPLSLVLTLAAYVVVSAATTPLSVFFSGIEWVGSQAAIAFVNAVVNVGLAFWLLPALKLPGMGGAMLAGMMVNFSGQLFLIWRLGRRGRR